METILKACSIIPILAAAHKAVGLSNIRRGVWNCFAPNDMTMLPSGV